MRNPFRREARGRHALGAAVTAIPAVPVRSAPAPVAVLPDDVWSSWGTLPVTAPLPSQPAPVPVPVPTQERTAPSLDVLPEPVHPAPVPQVSVQPVDLDPALLDLGMPAVPPAPLVTPLPAPTPSGPRVELGFADGSFRTLEPESPAAQQLSDLVEQLTRRQ